MAEAGHHARQMTRRLAWRALTYLIAIVAVAVAGGLAFGIRSAEFVVLELVAMAGMLAIDRFALPVIDRWDRGATGEETVGELLEALSGEGWAAIHDVDTGRGNIDHVVVGPGGVFTVETKSHGGRISVDHIDERMLKQAYAQRKWLENVTGERVEALLVFSRAYLDRPLDRRRGVLVLPARMLCGHLRKRPSVLAPDRARALQERLAVAIA